MKKIFILVIFILTTIQGFAQKKTITLDVVRAFNPGFPGLSDQNLDEILEEAKKIFQDKFGVDQDIIFVKHPSIKVSVLFKEVNYTNSSLYKSWIKYKYNLSEGASQPVFKNIGYINHLANYLSQFSLDSLNNLFPDKNIKDYQQAAQVLIETYHNRVTKLKSMKTKDGKKLISDLDDPQHSFVEWYSMMNAQDIYDIVFANSLIVFDLIVSPEPHSIARHAKVGGASFKSKKRKALDGSSIMVNILEDYGDVPGLKTSQIQDIHLRNKVTGAITLAHEMGHAIFHIPDVYDHDLSCLMNTPNGTYKSEELYAYLIEKPGSCKKCQPYIDIKMLLLDAEDTQDYIKKGDLYLKAGKLALTTFPKETISYSEINDYITDMFLDAFKSFKKVKADKKREEALELFNKYKNK